MDKIFHSTFDFFSHALPGFFVIAMFYLLDTEIVQLGDIATQVPNIGIETAIFLLLVGYVVGFAIYPLGRWLYKSIGKSMFRARLTNDVPLFISNKYALIRHMSPANFKYVELWNMFCSMSHNLAVAAILGVILVIYKLFSQSGLPVLSWIGFSIALLVLAILFLYRATKFSIWAADDINATIQQFDLAEKSKEIDFEK